MIENPLSGLRRIQPLLAQVTGYQGFYAVQLLAQQALFSR
jgi:hypothetical protein